MDNGPFKLLVKITFFFNPHRQNLFVSIKVSGHVFHLYLFLVEKRKKEFWIGAGPREQISEQKGRCRSVSSLGKDVLGKS